MHLPSSTYRIQLHKDFNLRDLQRILQYIHTLGISTLYASPIMQATPGSMHGYDVTDPHAINSELGTPEELKTIIRELHKKGIHWLQDIVPNHMAFHTENDRLMDVLERGPISPFYRYFDIDWDHPAPDLKGKVMVPFLGSEPETCLKNGELKLAFSAKGFTISYFSTHYPLSLPAYASITSIIERSAAGGPVASVLSKMIAAADGADLQTWTSGKREFLQAISEAPEFEQVIEDVVNDLNADLPALQALMEKQYYRLTFWKETDRRINYRRFFTVNELICLRMEDKLVFDEYHTYLAKLYREKLITGFRIDHIDGLKDPAGYTQQLRALMGESCYIIAEKILEGREEMEPHWPLHGTSGYEFLSVLNQLLTHRKGAKELLNFYRELVPDMPPYRELIFDSKKLILENYIAGEWDNLTHLLYSLNLAGDFARDRMRQALGFFMLSLPVYRIYPDDLPLKGNSLVIVHEAFEKAFTRGREVGDELRYLRDMFTGMPSTPERRESLLLFLRRLMQFTGPLTAKGVEDTTFYIYNPLISHDEVGDSPAPLGMSVERFHDKMRHRLRATPYSLNATATHDTKRGEDARVRINVLSRMPETWKEHVTRWRAINRPFCTTLNGRSVPEVNDEYFIYQSMLGGFPEDFTVTEEWITRVQAYLNKALREAKVNTNWSDPDEAYEEACEQFVRRILASDHGFLSTFVPFVRTVCEQAMVYSLSQTLIKLTAPGIPDVYQGCELWDLSFVDPDNRRPVDYEKRMEFLFQLVIKEEKGMEAVFDYLREHRDEGIEKLYVTWKTLSFRRAHESLFADGDYIPVTVTGREITAAAYARRRKDDWTIIAFPLGLIQREPDEHREGDGEQYLILPGDAPQDWMHSFTGESLTIHNQIPIRSLLSKFPVALLTAAYNQNFSVAARPTTF